MKHQYVVTYIKRTNLLDYMRGNEDTCADQIRCESARNAYYSKERDVRLILLIRYENGNAFCTIKCPINPLPVKGEFQVPSMHALNTFLVNHGWTKSDAFSSRMFE